MTTAELTAEINSLTADERQWVYDFVVRLKERRSARPMMRRYTEAEFFSALNTSRNQAKRGQVQSAYQSLAEVREKYGIPA